jgi:hypothetical protein
MQRNLHLAEYLPGEDSFTCCVILYAPVNNVADFSSNGGERIGWWACRLGEEELYMKKVTVLLGGVVAITALMIAVQLILESWRWTRYTEILAPPTNVNEQERSLREKLNYYEKSADEIKTLSSLLIGLSTLFGLALGVGSYLNVKETKEQFEADAKRLREAIDRELLTVRQNFPLFRDTNRSIQDIRYRLQKFIPDADYGRDVFNKIDMKDRVMIEHYERSVGTLEFFDLTPFKKDATGIYHMLGSYYSHKYSRENTEHKNARSVRSSNESPKPPDIGDIARAHLYLGRANEISPEDIGPLNEIGYLEVVVTNEGEKAVRFLERSLELQSDQQRARYYLSIVEHIQGNAELSDDPTSAREHYKESVLQLSKALDCKRWQAVEEPERYRRAIHYNRACGYARLAELARDEPTKDKLCLKAIGR